ncbi:MAG: nucleotidyltransferase [Promicromonosporaceae bacterium]|nr:nucleotidyltransferase [Promicromonosporaceae bacterium]
MSTYPTLEQLLESARKRIEVEPAELDEARKRRDAIKAALLEEFPDSRLYVNGSLAHGDALTPLTDVDLGVVVLDLDNEFGPGKKGPRSLQDRAAEAIRAELKSEYGDLRVIVKGEKRAVKVRFNDAVREGWDDFHADVIVAIDNPNDDGLYIPRFHMWDRSHPEAHTQLVLEANDVTENCYARTVRLIKHWNRRWDEPPLFTWLIKVLAFEAITEPGPLMRLLTEWFGYAAMTIVTGPVPDPVGVGPDLNPSIAREVAVRRLRNAYDGLVEATKLEAAGYPALAHAKLAQVFRDPEMLSGPSHEDLYQEQLRRQRATVATVSVASRATTPPVRSWSWI